MSTHLLCIVVSTELLAINNPIFRNSRIIFLTNGKYLLVTHCVTLTVALLVMIMRMKHPVIKIHQKGSERTWKKPIFTFFTQNK